MWERDSEEGNGERVKTAQKGRFCKPRLYIFQADGVERCC
jgi:hypothetical protein